MHHPVLSSLLAVLLVPSLAPQLAASEPAWPDHGSIAQAPGGERSRWRNVEIVGGGFVSGIVFHPTTKGLVYARTDMGGGYRRDPASGRWVCLTDFLSDYSEMGIESIALDPTDPARVYFCAGTSTASWARPGFILRSTNQGATWERFPLPFKCGANEDGRSIGERLAVDPLAPATLFLGARREGLWRSRDRGATWERVAGFPVPPGARFATGVGIVVFDPAPGTAPGGGCAVLYAATSEPGQSLWRSADGGATWSLLPDQPAGLIAHHVVVEGDGALLTTFSDAPGPNGVSDGRVCRYQPRTQTWTDLTPEVPKTTGKPGFGYAGLAVDAHDPAVIQVTTLCRWADHDRIFRSRDRGATWQEVWLKATRETTTAPYFSSQSAHWMGDLEIDPHDPDHQLFVTGAGIWETRDGRAPDRGQVATWAPGAAGLEEVAALTLVSPPTGAPLLSGILDWGGYRHDDLTRSPATGAYRDPAWSPVRCLALAGRDAQRVALAGKGKTKAGPVRGAYSSDQGRTWQPFASVPPGTALDRTNDALTLTAEGGVVLWIPEDSTAHRSRDQGRTWEPCAGLPATARTIAADAVDPALVVAHDGKQLYRSLDGGAHFTPAGAIAGGGHLRSVPGRQGEAWLAAGSKGLWRVRAGQTELHQIPGVTQADTLGFGAPAPGQDQPAVFLVGKVAGTAGIYRSDDAGATWIRINDDQHRYGWVGYAITGDFRQHGRAYLATNGRGIMLVEPAH